jgi:predicted glycoside hydrolase/deacetylase ChbG (UPF0249 family)
MNCHPGYVDNELKKLSAWTEYREIELNTLTRPEFKQLLDQHDIELITFSKTSSYHKG